MPTVLIVTANDPVARLGKLSEEGKEIQRTLNSAYGRAFESVLVPDTSIKDIIEEFKVPNRKIEVLHYAGHADSNMLRLTDGSASASALADKIRNQKTVKLVFLNGCATKGQVTYFHSAGVPFVIATSRPVGDIKAYWLATQFYQYLTLNRSLRQAMEEVVIDAKKLTEKIWFQDDRGICLLNEGAPEEDIEWGLYTNPGQENTDYSLPFSRPNVSAVSEVQHTVFLEKLVFSLEEVNSPALSEVRKLAINIRRGSEVLNDLKIRELLKVLPYALGVRLRQITAAPDKRSGEYYRELLYDYTFFFETLLHHTLALLSAQVWQDKGNTFTRLPKNIHIIRNFFRQNQLLEPSVNYVPAIEMLVAWLHDIDPGVVLPVGDEQLNYLRSNEFQQAADFFFLQKQYYWQRVRQNEEETLKNCMTAQGYINEAFQHFSFLVKHVMASVRDINVMNFRHLPLQYDNIVSKLLVANAEPTPISGQDMMENKSVLSFFEAEPSIDTSSLNLFPFIIDRNVFTGKPSKEVDLYLFVGYYPAKHGGDDCYHFVSVSNPGKVWCFDEKQHPVSLLHLDEETTLVHEQNHLMANAWEFKNYLTEYRKQFLQLIQQ